jgi:predicted nucleic acid-binding protein
MSRIFWDTNIFIYLFEDYGALSKRAVELRKSMLARGDQLLTSTFTLGEVLVKPLEKHNDELARKYEAALTANAVLIPFDEKAAKIYAALRADRKLRAPDIIQLACAASARVDLFITNDNRLAEKVVQGIQFVTSLERAPV